MSIDRQFGSEEDQYKNTMSVDPWKDPKVVAGVHAGELWALRKVLPDDAFEVLLERRRAGIFMGREDAEAARKSLEAWEGADEGSGRA